MTRSEDLNLSQVVGEERGDLRGQGIHQGEGETTFPRQKRLIDMQSALSAEVGTSPREPTPDYLSVIMAQSNLDGIKADPPAMLRNNGPRRLCAKICMNYTARPARFKSPGPRGEHSAKEQARY